jgi:hypothetical protein
MRRSKSFGEGKNSRHTRAQRPPQQPGMPPPTATPTNEAIEVRMNALRAITEDRSEDKFALRASLFMGIPVVVATAVVLSLFPDEQCDTPLRVWCVVEAARFVFNIVFYSGTVLLNPGPASQTRAYQRAIQHAEGMFTIVWFMLGNVWLFGSGTCLDTAPNLYRLELSLLVLGYLSLFFPCVVVILLLPFACFCFPCILRVLSRLNPGGAAPGATKDQISTLKKTAFARNMFESAEDARCAICLNEYEPAEFLRMLPCSHHFHTECVDEWLQMHSTCPACRANPFDAAVV